MTYSTIKRIEALEAAASPESGRHVIFISFSAHGDPDREPIGVEASTHLPAVDMQDGETHDEFSARLERMAPPVPEHCALVFEHRYAERHETERQA
jgi:hypothetical protein